MFELVAHNNSGVRRLQPSLVENISALVDLVLLEHIVQVGLEVLVLKFGVEHELWNSSNASDVAFSVQGVQNNILVLFSIVGVSPNRYITLVHVKALGAVRLQAA